MNLFLVSLLACVPPTPDAGDERVRRAAFHAALEAEAGPAWAAPVAGVAEADLALGAEVYTKSCVACHGEDGRGTGARAGNLGSRPADLTASPLPEAGWYAVLQQGSPGTAMAAWGKRLPPAQLLAVTRYSRRFREASAD
jgi:cytochrome c oxidase subunit 2